MKDRLSAAERESEREEEEMMTFYEAGEGSEREGEEGEGRTPGGERSLAV